MDRNKIIFAIIVASLGYFVDVYDLILFSVVRVPSLKSMGLNDSQILEAGINLLNVQMIGMLIGGVVFGILADRLGRTRVLFASILIYSVATLLNAYVNSLPTYYGLRFMAGFGLAGELGIAMTLVSEILPTQYRGYGSTLIGVVGMCGSLLAWPIAKHFSWQTAYLVGGAMGISLLFLRMKVAESELFQNKKAKPEEISAGNFFAFFNNKKRFFKFLVCLLVGLQLWFGTGVLIALSPEFAKALNFSDSINAGEAIFHLYIGVIAGSLFIGLLSQKLKSRKRALGIVMTLSSVLLIGFFFLKGITGSAFYTYCVFLGLTEGYWLLFTQNAVEQFGTNLRATAATMVTNFGRASLVPLSLLFVHLKNPLGIMHAGLTVAIITVVLSMGSLFFVTETFHKDLNYVD
jgi:putative MFS transporter